MASLRLLSGCAIRLTKQTLNNGVNTKIFTHIPESRLFSTSYIGMASNYIKLSYQDDIAVVKIDAANAKVNTLSREMFPEFTDAFKEIEKNDKCKGVVIISGKTTGFIAGADIRMLDSCKTQEEMTKLSKLGQDIFFDMEKSKKPIVSAIMGPAMGGGLEVALASHYRIAVNNKNTTLGLPEVMLGLLPGSGGTQRLPRLISLPDALDIMLTGKQVKAKKAKSLGIVDMLVEPIGVGITSSEIRTLEYLEEVAVKVARDLAKTGIPERKKNLQQKLMAKALEFEFVRNMLFNKVKQTVMRQTKGLYPAPLKIIEVVRAGIEQGKDKGYEAEAKGFGELGMTSESKALINLYFARTECKKNRFGNPAQPAKKIGVLGAGLMGAGIASVSIDKGYEVLLKDMSTVGLSRGFNQINDHLKKAIKRKKYSQMEADQFISNLKPQLTYDNFNKLDMVIEAVFEDINIKHRVVKEVEQIISPNCIFASNTSALPITEIAKASSRPDKVIGMHYFSPVEKMELLEIITTDKTSKDTTASAVQVGLKQGKVVIVVKDAPGFYTTRILSMASAELFNLFQEGVGPKEIDDASKKFGFPVGNATLLDEVGVDVAAHIAEFLGKAFGERGSSKAGLPILQAMVKNGFNGRKSGKGVYIYEQGVKGSDRPVNPGFTEIIQQFKIDPPAQIKNDMETIQWRLASKFINEAVLCLQEGIVASPTEGDIGAVFGLGFPPNRGGPFKFVDTYGADKILAKLNFFEQAYGIQFKACDMLKDYAKDTSKKFYPSK